MFSFIPKGKVQDQLKEYERNTKKEYYIRKFNEKIMEAAQKGYDKIYFPFESDEDLDMLFDYFYTELTREGYLISIPSYVNTITVRVVNFTPKYNEAERIKMFKHCQMIRTEEFQRELGRGVMIAYHDEK